MKIAVTAQGNNLESKIDPRFGRAHYFIFIDTDTLEFEAISNESAAGATHGAGIQTSQLISEKGITAVITGNVGPNAFQTLAAAKINIFHADNMSVLEAVEAFKNEGLKQVSQSGPAHAGINKH